VLALLTARWSIAHKGKYGTPMSTTRRVYRKTKPRPKLLSLAERNRLADGDTLSEGTKRKGTDPLTPAQKRYLINLGATFEEGCTITEANRLIKQARSRKRDQRIESSGEWEPQVRY
jgi:hypothetical protein